MVTVSRHQVGHGSGKHGANAKFCQFSAFVGSERADPAELNSNRTEIREAAERKGRNRK